MATESFELKMWDWLVKVNEKLTIIQIKVSDGKDLNEAEEELLRVLHQIWHRGEYPIYASRLLGTDEKAIDQGLFAVNLSDSKDGTKID